MKQIDQAERARINALRAAHYAAQKGEVPAPKKKPGRPKKTETVKVDVTTFEDDEPKFIEVEVPSE